MRTVLWAWGLCLVLASCEPSTDPEQHLTEKEQATLLERLAPYTAPAPKGVEGRARLDARHSTYYRACMSQMELAALVVDATDTSEFLLYSMGGGPGQKPLAIVGKVYPLHGDGDFAYYHEAFRTWQMAGPVLHTHAERLFDLYREGGNLAPYENAAGRGEWIELPNEYTHFSDEGRTWLRDETLD